MSQGLTTVTVAHRVNTIRTADIIYVIERGNIKEKGEFVSLERYQNVSEMQEEKEQQGFKE